MHDGVPDRDLVRFAAYEADLQSAELRKHGMRIKLQERPFRILRILLREPGRVVSREELRSQLWPEGTFVDFDHGISSAVNKLRDALCDSADNPRFIETVGRSGYRFIGQVERIAIAPVAIAAAPPVVAPPAEATPVAASELPLTIDRSLRQRTAIFLSIALLVAAATWLGIRQSGRRPSTQPIRSIAVLPLENLSNDRAQDYFAEGITDELITDLANSANVRVISRTSSMRYRNTTKSVPQIGRELGVDALVEGSVEKYGDRVRIRAQLLRTSSDEHIWAATYNGAATDAFSLEDRVAADVSDNIARRITPQLRRASVIHRIADPHAYEEYLRGRYYWNQRTPDAYAKALTHFQAAIAADPRYAAAYSGIADTYLLLGGITVPPDEAIARARAAAQRAIELDDLAEAHASLGLIASNHDWDWTTAEREYRRAIELNPNYATAHHWYGETFLALQGRFDEAVAEMRRAAELDPLSPIITADTVAVFYLSRRYDEGIAAGQQAVALYPDFLIARIWLALCYHQKGLDNAGIAVLGGHTVDDDDFANLTLAALYIGAGRREDALRIFNKTEQSARVRYVDPVWFALMSMELRRYDAALTYLERDLDMHSQHLVSLKVNPFWDPIRSQPRFQRIAQKLHYAP